MLSTLARSVRTTRSSTLTAGARTMASGKDVRFGASVRAQMLVGVDKLADAVGVTLGPKGRNVLIDQSFGAPKITKDGVTVAKAIDFKDRFQNMGAQLVRQVASKTNDIAGDGTTTATVLARAIFSEGCKSVAAGMKPMDLRRGIALGVDEVVKELTKLSKKISTTQEITQVGTISANNDFATGEMIARAMEKVGKEGVITVQDGRTLEDELEVVEGMKFDRGYISPYFMTDTKTQKCEFEDPYILLVEKKIATVQSIVPVLEAVMRESKPLVIIAEDVESEALATLILNKLRSGLKVVAVKAPGFGDNRKANMQDLAELTGGTLISEDLGLKVEATTIAQLGRAKKVSVSKDDTIVLGGGGDPKAIADRCEQLRETIEATKSDYEKEKLQERLAKLSGGIAVLKIGGASEVEVNEKKDRVTDALNATRAAVEEGIVPGGGCALLYASQTLGALAAAQSNHDIRVGIEIVGRAVLYPAKLIVENAGRSGEVIVAELLKQKSKTYGFNSQDEKYCDMIDAGIIDPLKVVRTALVDAASVAGLMVTTEAAIADLPSEDKPMMGGGGGMPGMGGMGGGMDF